MSTLSGLTTQVNLKCLKMVSMNFSCPKPGDRHQNKCLKCSEPKFKFGHVTLFWLAKMAKNVHLATKVSLMSISSVWKWYQWIFHSQKPGDRHQKQVSGMFRTKVTILAMFWVAEMAKNVHLATQVNLRCPKMVPMNFSCSKTWGYTPKTSL